MKSEHFLCLLLTFCFPLYTKCEKLKPDCAAVSCVACPDLHKAVTSKNECCPQCVPQCLCPDFLMDACKEHGFKDGILLQGESVYTDFGTRKCTCVAGATFKCASTCPAISPKCKFIGRPMDGCGMCACPTKNDHFIGAGKTIKTKCEICVCPSEGGKLHCVKQC